MDRRGFTSMNHRRELGFMNERVTRNTIIGNVDFIQRLKVDAKLEVHRGCVNTICWNDTGSYILSGSDDKKLCITDPMTRKAVTSIQSGHRSNIFSARFLPVSKNRQIVSCSGDGIIAYNDVEREDVHGRCLFNCHYGTAYEVITMPNDPYTFLSCGEDYTVRWFDLRTKTSCMKDDCKEDILINCHRAVTSLAVNPVIPYHLGVGCSDSSVRVFDRRMLGTRATGNYIGRGIQGMFSRFCPSHLQNKYSRPTSLHYSADGQDILVSYSTDYVYLFSPNCSDREEKQFSSDTDGAAESSSPADKDENASVNPVKKLRLRGDWSDTGPKARPRSEQNEELERPRLTIIQRMSEMLTRWLEDTSHARRPTPNTAESQSTTDVPTTNDDNVTSSTDPVTAESTETVDQSTAGTSTSQDDVSRDVHPVESDKSSDEKYVSATSEVEPEEMSSDSELSQRGSSKSKKTVKRVSLRRVSSSDSSDTVGVRLGRDNSAETRKEQKMKNEVDMGAKLKRDCSSKELKGETNVQYDGKAKDVCVGDVSSLANDSVQTTSTGKPSNGADCDSKLLTKHGESTDKDQEAKTLAEHNKRKRSPNNSPSGSFTEDRGNTSASCQVGPEEAKHIVKALRVKEGGKDPDDPHSSDSDDEVKVSSAIDSDRVKLDHVKIGDRKQSPDKKDESVSSAKRDSSSVQSSLQRQTCSEETVASSSTTMEDTLDSSHMQGDIRLQLEQSVSSNEDESPVFALGDRKEDANPQERKTSQFKIPSTRVRKMSVSGPPGAAPNEGFDPGDESERSARSSTNDTGHSGTQEGAVNRSQSGSGGAAAAGSSDESTRQEPPESPSMTNSESDSDDDAILGPPRGFRHRQGERRQRGMSSDEQRERESPINVSAENRLRELLRARALRKEREKEDQQMQSVYSPTIKKVYRGHRNSRTMIKEANFWGNNYVMSGSDCGHVFIWDKHTSNLVMLLEGDRHVVNCVQPHPFDPVLATSGIDYDIKLWAPLAEYPSYPADADEVMRINELMLEETRDTITVPPSFMLRMLASINHLNAGTERRRRESHSSSDEES